MNINNQPPVATNFKAIQPEIMQNLGKYSRNYRESIARNYNILQNSDVVDLVLNDSNNIVLRTKKILKNFIGGYSDIPAGSEIKFNGQFTTAIDGSKVICKDIDIRGEVLDNKIIMDFASPQLAEKANKTIDCHSGETYADKLPQLGALIDAAHKISEPLEKIKEIISNTLIK